MIHSLIRRLPFVTRGKGCPRCARQTRRVRTPWYWRPLRILLRRPSGARLCHHCGIRWLAVITE